MRRLPMMELVVVAIIAIGLIVGWRVYGMGEMGRYAPAIKAQKAPSELYAKLTIRYSKPPIYEEEYSMQDVEGVSSFSYRIRSYECRQITINQPSGKIYDVSFFFGGLVQDGVWQLVNRDPRPNATAFYTVYVKQLADYKQGDRTVTFTDPKYWATLPGQRYQMDLSKQNPNDFLTVKGTSVAEPEYQKIVDDFRNFGPDEFRRNVATAQARARAAACS